MRACIHNALSKSHVSVASLLLVLLSSAVCGQDWSDRYAIGITLIQPAKGKAPVFIGEVRRGSPAALAGVLAGDRLLAVDGFAVATAGEAARLTTSDKPRPVTLRLWRLGKEYEIRVEREKFKSILSRQGLRATGDGLIVPIEASDAEAARLAQLTPDRIVARAFPHHFPLNPESFSAGFEVLLLRDPLQAIVTGIELGPAWRAGLHNGDVILSIDGVDPQGKPAAELEDLLSSSAPKTVRLEIDRLGQRMKIELKLQRTSELMKENQRRLVDGVLVPYGLADEDVKWFLPR